MAVGAIFASLAYGQNNTAEQTWLERVIQDMYDIVQQTPLYQSWTRKALEEGEQRGLEKGKLEGMRQTLVSIVRVRFPHPTLSVSFALTALWSPTQSSGSRKPRNPAAALRLPSPGRAFRSCQAGGPIYA